MPKNRTKPSPATCRPIEAAGTFANLDLPFKQAAALETIMTATGDNESTTAAKVISVGLFALGLDGAGDFCLDGLTRALHGAAAADVFNVIVDAGGVALDARRAAEVEARRRSLLPSTSRTAA